MKFQKQFFKKYFLFPQACFISSSFIPSFLPYPLIIWSLTFFSHPSRISCLMSIFCLLPAFSMIQPPIENAFHSLCPLFPWACLLLICHLLTFVVVISCNSVPVISDSCFTSDCVTSRPPAFHSHLLSVVIAFSTLVYCLCSSLIYHVFHLALILSHFQIYVALFLNFLVIVHLFCELFFFFFPFSCPRVVGITRWICFQYLHRTQIFAVYFLGSQDESIIINFSQNIELPVFSASKSQIDILED